MTNNYITKYVHKIYLIFMMKVCRYEVKMVVVTITAIILRRMGLGLRILSKEQRFNRKFNLEQSHQL